jgi:tripartite-type tricarboxylate transporter receptor subunit TctC
MAAGRSDHAGALRVVGMAAQLIQMTKGYRMFSCRAVLAAVAVCALAQPVHAQTYPSQNITFVVGFAAGGIADVVARLVGQKLSERLGHTVVVENRGGAGGNLAAKAVSGAAPDGYTILATTTSLAVNETASKNKGFSVNDLRTIAIAAISPDVLAVHPSNPAKDLKEFIRNGKDKSFTYGSAGVGTGPHIGAEFFFREVAKVQAVHVPFTGGAPAVQAAIGNHIDAIVLTLPTVVPPMTQGLLRGIGLASPARNSAVPNVPTYGEMGFPNVYSGSWVGFFAPAKTPDAVIAKLNAEINAIMKEPEVQQKLATIGFDPIIKTTAEAADYFSSEVANWGKMTRAIGYSSD